MARGRTPGVKSAGEVAAESRGKDAPDVAGWFNLDYRPGDRIRLYQVEPLSQRKYLVANLSPDQCSDEYVSSHPLLGGGNYLAQLIRADGANNSLVVRESHSFSVGGRPRRIEDPTPLTGTSPASSEGEGRIPGLPVADGGAISPREALDHIMLKQLMETVRGGAAHQSPGVDWAALAAALSPIVVEIFRGRQQSPELLTELRALRESLAERPQSSGAELLKFVRELDALRRGGGASGDTGGGDDDEAEDNVTRGVQWVMDAIGRAIKKRPALGPGEGEPMSMDALAAALIARLRTAAAAKTPAPEAAASLVADVPESYRGMLKGLLSGTQVGDYLRGVAPDLVTSELLPWTADVLEAVKAAL